MTTDELLAYQRALYVVAPECAEKVRRHGGSARDIAEEFDRVVALCGWPEPQHPAPESLGRKWCALARCLR